MASGVDCSDVYTNSNRKISDVWKYFTKTPDKKKAICSICHKELAYSGGTTNLRDHVSSKHPLQYFPAGKTATGSKTTTLDGFVRPSKCSEARAKGITDRVSQMIVQDLRPIRLVECEGFRNLLSYLEPGYTLPSRKQFSMEINHKFEACKDKLKKCLEAEALSMALTTDIWTSMATEEYMTVTAHYIDPNLKLQNFVLETLPFPERHTGVNVAEKLKGVGERWGITHKVIIVNHDQGSNMEAAMEILTEECNWQSLACSAHRLQLCILAGLKVNAIDKLTAAVKKIVSHFSHSVVATEALKNKQQQMNITAKKLINSCPTRWNSTYEMLERVLKLRWPISRGCAV